ncbi:MAG: site-specific integrase [Anaerolineae bacterium]|nr:site-specific integrase [Anaerolineae bacterium]
MSLLPHSEPHSLTSANDLRTAFDVLAYGLTETSKRQYQHTFDAWRAWCAATGTPAHDLSAAQVIAFLDRSELARKTKMARLTHLRRLAQTLHTGDVSNPQLRQNYEQLQLLKLPKDDHGGQTRERKALAPDEVYAALQHWPTDTNLGRRNRALLAVLFYAGLRRSELMALQWADVDMGHHLVTVRHGKGNQERTIPFASPKALDLLSRWRACIPHYDFMFVAVNKGDHIQADQPISTETVRRVCLASGDFRPHDARRTLLTNLLTSGTDLPDAQFIAGHANGATTMHYSVVKDANTVKGRIKLNY